MRFNMKTFEFFAEYIILPLTLVFGPLISNDSIAGYTYMIGLGVAFLLLRDYKTFFDEE